MGSPTTDADELTRAVRADLTRALIAVDFDGTLAPIVADPAMSRPAPGAIEALRQIAERGGQVAVITGRDADTVVTLGGLDTIPGVIVEGLYGAEQWRDGKVHSLDEPDPIVRLRDELPAAVAAHSTDEALWIEDKRLSLVVHGRRAADPDAALEPLLQPLSELADALGLELHPGRGVIELRLPGYDKGLALRRLIDRIGPSAVVFIGDDLGDLPAFRVIDEIRAAGFAAWSVAATSDEAPEVAAAAHVHVDGPHGVVELLAAIGT